MSNSIHEDQRNHLNEASGDGIKHTQDEVVSVLDLVYTSRNQEVAVQEVVRSAENLPLQATHNKEHEEPKRRTNKSSPLPPPDFMFNGRYVTIMASPLPFLVTKHFFKPKLIRGFDTRVHIENILRKLSGEANLSDVLIMFTPTKVAEKEPDHLKMHFYCLSTQKHLGVTSLSTVERDMVERSQSKSNFSMIFCSRHIGLEDAAKNSPIQALIFEVARAASPAKRHAWYRGNALSLLFRQMQQMRVGLRPASNLFHIKALEEPKIPVRMRHQSHSFSPEATSRSSLRHRGPGHSRRTYQRRMQIDMQGSSEPLEAGVESTISQTFEHNRLRKKTTQEKLRILLAKQKRKTLLKITMPKKPSQMSNHAGNTYEEKEEKKTKRSTSSPKVAKEHQTRFKRKHKSRAEQTEADQLIIKEDDPELLLQKRERLPNKSKKNKINVEKQQILEKAIRIPAQEELLEVQERKGKSSRQHRPAKEEFGDNVACCSTKAHHRHSKRASRKKTLSSHIIYPEHSSSHKTVRFANILNDQTSMSTKGIQKSEANRDNFVTEEEPEESTDGNGVKFLWKPQQLKWSVAQIPSPCTLAVSTPSADTCLFNKSSDLFEQLLQPVQVPVSYSQIARIQFQDKLRTWSAKEAFVHLGCLIETINEQACPKKEHLINFFQFAEILDFKMFARDECTWPGFAPTTEPRYRIECYVFEDRKDFIASIALLCTQLQDMMVLFPFAASNVRFVEDAFALTPMPRSITTRLKQLLSKVCAEPVYSLLGELTYEWLQPPAALLKLALAHKLEEERQQRHSQQQL